MIHTHKNTFTLETFIAIMQLTLGEKMLNRQIKAITMAPYSLVLCYEQKCIQACEQGSHQHTHTHNCHP